jgi:hypothetical protein
MNQEARKALLKSMPTLDDIDIASVWQGDQSHGMVTPRMVVAGDQGGTATGGQGGTIVGGYGGGAIGGNAAVSSVSGMVRVPLHPPARARRRRCVSLSISMRCRPIRTFRCRSGCFAV